MISMDLNVLEAQLQRHKHNATVLLAKVERENREITEEEVQTHELELKSIERVGQQIQRIKGEDGIHAALAALTGSDGEGKSDDGRRIVLARGREVKSLGQQFVDSETGKYTLEKKHHGQDIWRSTAVELKATLTEDPASGGALVVPEYRPGIIPGATKPPTVAQLLAKGTTEAGAITFMRELLFTNAAAPVLEGGVKPESTLTFEQVMNALRKIAHFLPATDEILEDAPTLRSYIDMRLRQGIDVKLDDQLLNGDGIAPNLLGLLNTPGLAPPVAQGTGSGVDAIAAQIAAIQTATGLVPDGVVVHPNDWLWMQLVKDADGNYLGSGPFAAPVQPTLWGLRVAPTSAIAAGTALVGAFSTAAQLFTKGGIRVESTNSHQDWFQKNLVAIRAEIRAALLVYRPAAFGKCTGLAAPVPPA